MEDRNIDFTNGQSPETHRRRSKYQSPSIQNALTMYD